MTDEVFIQTILQRGKEAKEKVGLEFSGLSFRQLNWKPSLQSWSIAQCLEHLVRSHSCYFPVLEKIIEGRYHMNFWEKFSPFTSLCGRLLIKQLQEQPRKKFKAPKKIQPSASEIQMEIVEDYQKNLNRFLEYISACRKIDVDKTIIASPTIPIVTYTLRDAFTFLLQHEDRHINQAAKVKANQNFPINSL